MHRTVLDSVVPVSSNHPVIQRLGSLDRASSSFLDELTAVFSKETTRDLTLDLSVQDAQWLADYLDHVRTAAPTQAVSRFIRPE